MTIVNARNISKTLIKNGASQRQVAKVLTTLGIERSTGTSVWTHQAVGRLIG